MKKIRRIMIIIACIMVCGCANKNETVEMVHSDIDEDFYRVTMGYGFAQKVGDMLYTQDMQNIYESMNNNGKMENVKVIKDTILDALNVLGDNIYYRDNDDRLIERTIETGETRVVFDKAYLTDIYVCPNGYTYALCGREGPFVKIKTEDGSYEEICKNVMIYAKYGDDLYYIWDKGINENGEGGTPELWKYSEESGKKEKIELGYQPISLYVYRDKVYFTTYGDWQLYVYDLKNGEIEKPDVPMMYWYYINNDYLYYMDEEMLREEGRSAVKRYSLTKKTTEMVYDGAVLHFTVFTDGSVVVFEQSGEGYANVLLEEKNGEWNKTGIR